LRASDILLEKYLNRCIDVAFRNGFSKYPAIDIASGECQHDIKCVIMGGTMVRTQIQLTEQQAKAVKTISKQSLR
jgi:hypothetical protein